jgi:leucyl aminopeptidase
MKLSKSTKENAYPDRVILVRDEKQLANLIKDESQREYVRKRFLEDRDTALLNLLDHHLIVCRLKGGDLPEGNLREDSRKAAHSISATLYDLNVQKLTLVNGGVNPSECLAFAEGLALSSYQFLKYKTGENAKPHALKEISILDEETTEASISELRRLTEGVYEARDLVNEPLSYLTAEQLAKEFVRMGGEAGFEVEVFNKKKIESLKMGGLLAVNRGSVDPPTFTIMTYKAEKPVNEHPIILVGKGVVYDTGGLSLKPTHDSMDYMKCDMGGAAAVGGAMYSVARNKLPLWVIGLVPATDNRPDGNAYVPGDVVTMYDGTTVEVLNTDAEGRMLLADALSYAKQYDPELVIELSTLTGSAHAAIDKYGIVGMGNASREIMEELRESGELCSERIAEFPYWDEYKEQLKSEIADLKNIGGRYGGAITAGKFLEHFTDYPYIHLDIAGPSFNKMPFNYRGKGGSGVGVRIVYQYLQKRAR